MTPEEMEEVGLRNYYAGLALLADRCATPGMPKLRSEAKYAKMAFDQADAMIEELKRRNAAKESGVRIVSAGADPEGKGGDTCCDCQQYFEEDDIIRTCTHFEYVSLCEKCYAKRGNTVR